jgi:uncharacterized RDD family membrane protein YckC
VTVASVSGPSAVASSEFGDGRIADADRRFHAFAVDRLVAWSIDAAVAVVVVRTLADDHLLLGIAVIAATVLAVGLLFAVLQGSTGRTPGKSLTGLRLVDTVTERPIGARRAVLRGLVLGLAAVRSASAWPPSRGPRSPTGRVCAGAGTTAWCPRSWSTYARSPSWRRRPTRARGTS